MSIRLLLAVVLAGSLVAASMPAIQVAQQTLAENRLASTVEDIESTADSMCRNSDPVRPGVPGATRHVDVSIPDKPSAARLRIGPRSNRSPANGTLLTRHVPGTAPDTTVLDTSLRPVGPDGTVRWNESITVREPTELTLTYRRVDGRSVITVARGFK